MSLRDAFRQAAQAAPRLETVEVPGIGEVFVRPLTGAAYDQYEQACALTERKDGDRRARLANRHLLIRLSVVDADGKPVFAEADDEFLKNLPVAATGPIVQKAAELAGLGGDDPGNG